MLSGLAVASVATAALGFVTPPPLFLAVSLVAGMGSGLVNPPMNAAVADVIGSRARGGTVLAGFQMAADLGAIVGPPLAGLLAESAGFSTAFVVTGAVTLLALVFWLRAPETLPRSPAAPSAHAAEDSIAGCAVAEDPAPRRLGRGRRRPRRSG